jgi:hypothetical protein
MLYAMAARSDPVADLLAYQQSLARAEAGAPAGLPAARVPAVLPPPARSSAAGAAVLPAHVYESRVVFDNAYAESLSVGVFRLSVSDRPGPSRGKEARALRAPARVIEIELDEFSFPHDTPWGSAAVRANREELTVFVQEVPRDAHRSVEHSHHFRGPLDSTDRAATLYHSGVAGAALSTAITADVAAHNSARVRWYKPRYVFTEPVTAMQSAITLEFRRGGVLVPFRPCRWTDVSADATAGAAINFVFRAGSGDIDPALVLLVAGDVIYAEEDILGNDGVTVVVEAGRGYTVAGSDGTTITTNENAPATLNTTFVSGFVVPKWRFQIDVRVRGISDGPTNFVAP